MTVTADDNPFDHGYALGRLEEMVRTAARTGMASRKDLALALHTIRRHEALERLRFEDEPETRRELELRLEEQPGSGLGHLEEMLGPEKGPQDEEELTEWLAVAAASAVWTEQVRVAHLGSHGASNALMRTVTKDQGTLRLAVNFGWNEELESEFDSSFP